MKNNKKQKRIIRGEIISPNKLNKKEDQTKYNYKINKVNKVNNYSNNVTANANIEPEVDFRESVFIQDLSTGNTIINEVTLTDGTIENNATDPKDITNLETVNDLFDENLPWTQTGDVVYLGPSNTPTRLGIGFPGQVLTADATGVPIWTVGGGGSGVTTGNNAGVMGVGPFINVTAGGTTMNFKNINDAGNNRISVVDDAINNEIDLDVVEGNLNLANIGGNLNLVAQVTAILGISNGGTGTNSHTSNGVLIGNGVSPITSSKQAPSGDFVGTSDTQILTNKTITDSTNSVSANLLRSATTNIDIASSAAPSSGQILIATSGTAATWQNPPTGEVNTASNQGTGGGATIFLQKTGDDLEFNGINVGSNKLSVTNNLATNEVDIDVNEANLDLANMGGNLNVSSQTTGTLGVANGGTGATTLTANEILTGNGTSAVQSSGVQIDGSQNITNLATLTGQSGSALNINSLANQNINLNPNGSGIVRVNGDLDVTGTTTTINTQELAVQDNNILLNSNYTSTTVQNGGIAVLYSAAFAPGIINGGAFTSTTTVDTLNSASFSNGDIIAISGADDINNNGLFEVSSSNATTITIKTVPDNSVSDIVKTSFDVDSTIAGQIVKANLALIRNKSDGTFEIGSGSSTPITYRDIVTTDGPQTINLTSQVTGILAIANGGTNSSTALNNNRVMVSSGGSIVEQPALNDGQLLIGSTGGAPTNANLNAGNGIDITNASGSITISADIKANSGIIIDTTELSLDLSASGISGTLGVANGGTGTNSHASNGVLLGNGTSPITSAKQAPTGDFIGTTDIQTITNKNITDSTNSVSANLLRTATTNVNIAASAAPTAGQILIATNGTAATWQTPATPGEVNTASNEGAGGVGVFLQKTGSNLEFKNINDAGSGRITVTNDVANNEIDLDVNEANLTLNNVGGTLAVAKGGTGAITLEDGGILLGSGTGAITATAQPTNGQILIGNTGSDPTLGTLGAGDGIDVISAAGSITVAADVKTDSGIVIDTGELSLDLGASNITGTLGVADGGTGATTHTSNGVLLGAGTSPITSAKQAPSGDFVGTSDSQSLSNKTITNSTINDPTNTVTSDNLRSATTVIDVSSSTAPTAGQVLTATNGTAATWQTPAAPGEVNTASNQGAAGVGVFSQKTGSDLEFKNINDAGSGRITVVDDAANAEIDLDVNEANLDLANIGGNLNVSSQTTGTLAVANGGTGATTHTSNGVLLGNGTSAITSSKQAPTGDFVGTSDTQTLVNKTINDPSNTVTSDNLRSATTVIDTGSSAAPTSGQVLTATSGTTATWQTPTPGEVNTASNQGAAGVGVFIQKTGSDLEFKNINDAGSGRVTVTNDAVNNEIDLDVNEANLDRNNIGGGALTVQNGGTGTNSHASNEILTGNGTSAIQSSGIEIDGSQNITNVATLTGQSTSALNISSLANQNINLNPNGTGIVRVNGDLDVTGTTTTINSAELTVDDNNILLNSNYNALSTQTGGVSIVLSAVFAAGNINGGGFPTTTTVDVDNAASFANGDIIVISGANILDNNGIYEVDSVTATTITIKAVPDSSIFDIARTSFTIDATASGQIVKPVLAIQRASGNNTIQYSQGSSTPITYNDVVLSGGSQTIDLATQTTGTLAVNDGGTGATTHTSNGVLLGNGTSPITSAKQAPTGDFVGTTDTQSMSNKTITNSTINDPSNTVTTDNLRSATTIVDVSSSAAPTAGQVLTATNGTAATWQTPAAPGEVNTASNEGAAGVGVFIQKTGANLEFKNINDAGSGRITVVDDAANAEIDLDVNEANLNRNNIGGGALTVANGGTGATSLADGGILLGSGAGAITATAQPINGQLLIGSTGGDPILATLSQSNGLTITNGAGSITLAARIKANGGLVFESGELAVDLGGSNITGTLVVQDGGTGATTLTDGGILLGSGTGPLTATAQPINGQLLIGNTGGDPVLAGLTEGDGIAVSNGAGSITLTVDIRTNSGLVFNLGQLSLDLSASDITGTLAVQDGGTGAATHTLNGVLLGAGTGPITSAKQAPTGDFVGTTDTQTLTNKTINDPTNTVTTDNLRSATTVVDVSSSAAPVAGQVLTAVNGTSATWQTPAAVGEVNTASNQGAAGVGVFLQKVGTDLEFKNINDAGSGRITVTNDAANAEVDLDVNEANLDLANIGGNLDVSTQTTGTLAVANGGTGNSTLTSNEILTGNGTSPIQSSGVQIDGSQNITNVATLTGQSGSALNIASLGNQNINLNPNGTGIVRINGDLDVTGTTTTIDTEELTVQDNNILLNSNYVSTTNQNGGISVITSAVFTAGTINGAGFPTTTTVDVDNAASFAANDLIVITNEDPISNSGVYEVASVTATTITIKSVPDSSVLDLVKTSFTTSAVIGGNIIKANLTIQRTGTTGAFEIGQGSSTPIVYREIVTEDGTAQINLSTQVSNILSVVNGGTSTTNHTVNGVLIGNGVAAVTSSKQAPSGDFVGTSDTQTLTNKTITDSTNSVSANLLRSATTNINIAGSAAPTVGQVLTAVNSTSATWQTPTPGEVNTASNEGVAGVGVFIQKTGTNLEFKNINDAGSGRITVTNDAANGEIDLDVSEANLDLANIGGSLNLASQITGTLGVANGGTGSTTLTDGGILLGSGTGAITATGQPTNGQLLVGRTGLDPILTTLTAGNGIDVSNASGSITILADLKANGGIVFELGELALDLSSSDIAGTLAVQDGGTGATTLTDGGILLGSGTNAITSTNQPTNGQLLIGSTGADPVLGNLTQSNGLTITNGAGTIDLAANLKANGGLVFETGEIAVDLGASNITGTLGVADGGTGATTFTSNNILTGNGTSAIQNSGITIDVSQNIGNVNSITGQTTSALTLASANNQNIDLTPNGTGTVQVNAELDMETDGIRFRNTVSNAYVPPAFGGSTLQNNEIRSLLGSTDAGALRIGAGGGTATTTYAGTEYIGFNSTSPADGFNLSSSATQQARYHYFRDNGGNMMMDINSVSDEITARVPLNMNTTNKIINLADPTAAQDSATKNYVDTEIADLVTGPASATSTAIARFDGGTGKLIQNSSVTLDNAGNMLNISSIFAPSSTDLTISTVTSGNDISLVALGAGSINLNGFVSYNSNVTSDFRVGGTLPSNAVTILVESPDDTTGEPSIITNGRIQIENNNTDTSAVLQMIPSSGNTSFIFSDASDLLNIQAGGTGGIFLNAPGSISTNKDSYQEVFQGNFIAGSNISNFLSGCRCVKVRRYDGYEELHMQFRLVTDTIGAQANASFTITGIGNVFNNSAFFSVCFQSVSNLNNVVTGYGNGNGTAVNIIVPFAAGTEPWVATGSYSYILSSI